MLKTIILYLSTAICVSILFSCNTATNNSVDTKADTAKINTLLDGFNKAAATANYDAYFAYFADNAVFTGTDATERWDKKSFMVWAKPFFDKGKAWDFTTLGRHIYFDKAGNTAWFDEMLSTQMKICRGSGVLSRQGDNWKIEQYILSVTVPNDQLDSVIKMKAAVEDSLMKRMK